MGLGILLQSAVLLVFDTFAHHRALHYVEWLIALPPARGWMTNGCGRAI